MGGCGGGRRHDAQSWAVGANDGSGALCTKPLAQKLASTSQRSGSGARGVSTSAIIGSSLVSRVVRRNQVNGKAGSDMDSHESGSDGSTDATLLRLA